MLSSSRIFQTVYQPHTKSKSQDKDNLESLITITKTDFPIKNSIYHKRVHSLDSKLHREIQKIQIHFKKPTKKSMFPELRTRCNSNGSGASAQQQDYHTPSKYNKLKEEVKSLMINGKGRNSKNQGVNQIKGLKGENNGFPKKKIDLGVGTFYLRGRRIN